MDERHFAEMEMNIIGALCAKPAIAAALIEKLVPEDFGNSLCRGAFIAACGFHRERKPFDALLLQDALSKAVGENEASEFVRLCMTVTVTTANAEEYAEILHERGVARRLSGELTELLLSGEYVKGSDMAAEVVRRCRTVLENEKRGKARPLSDALQRMYDGLGGKRNQVRVDTGLEKLDALLKGLVAGNLSIIGARPGVGKSAFALGIAENAARSGGRVLIYSMEMTDEELAERMVARHGVELDTLIESENLTSEQYMEISRACAGLSRLPIFINDAPNMTVGEIRQEAVATEGLTLIIVDFLSLMKSREKYERRYLELGAISRELKNLAAELKIPVILLCQLNRERDETERPTLANLRDSGELEQNANKVLLLWNEDKEQHYVGVSVAKNRRGRVGDVRLYFDGAHMRFSELDYIHDEPGGKRGKWKKSNEDSPW